MRTFIATISAAVLGFSSLTFADSVRADSFSISYSDGISDGPISFLDDEYSGSTYYQTPVYIVHNDWSPPRARYNRRHGRDYWDGYGHRRHHKHHKRHGHHRGHHHRGHHHKHRRHCR